MGKSILHNIEIVGEGRNIYSHKVVTKYGPRAFSFSPTGKGRKFEWRFYGESQEGAVITNPQEIADLLEFIESGGAKNLFFRNFYFDCMTTKVLVKLVSERI